MPFCLGTMALPPRSRRYRANRAAHGWSSSRPTTTTDRYLQSVAHDGVLPVAGMGRNGDYTPALGQGGLQMLLAHDDHLPADHRQRGQEQFADFPGEAHEMAEDAPGQALPGRRAEASAVGKLQVGQGDAPMPPVQAVPEGRQAPHQPVAATGHDSLRHPVFNCPL